MVQSCAANGGMRYGPIFTRDRPWTSGGSIPHYFPVRGLSFRDKKSLATAFARSLRPMAFTGSPHDPGMQVLDRVFDHPGGGRSLTTTLKDARGTFQHCLLPLMDHRRMDLISGRHFRHRERALQRHPRFERRVMVPAFDMV